MPYKVMDGFKAVREGAPQEEDQRALLHYLKRLGSLGPDAPDEQIGMLLWSRNDEYFDRLVIDQNFVIGYMVIPRYAIIAVRFIRPFDEYLSGRR